MTLRDGVSEDEAVELALWNEPAFRQALVELEIAEADLWQAGLLPNPTLRIQFPVDAKQFEGTLGWALDALWTRPWRVASARNAWGATAQRLVEAGLRTASSTRLAFIDARAGAERAALEHGRAELLNRVAAISGARAARGEVVELESTARQAAAIRAREDARWARQQADGARMVLLQTIGADESLIDLQLGQTRGLPAAPDVEFARSRALDTHPSVLAARLRVDAATEQVAFQKRSIVRFAALLDANEEGANGFEIGPGLDVEIPLFDRNQAGIARAEALLEQARWAYAGERRRVSSEVTRVHRLYAGALGLLERWRDDALPAAGHNARLMRRAEQRGSAPYTDLIAAEIQLLETELRAIEIEAAARRALVHLEESIGRRIDDEH